MQKNIIDIILSTPYFSYTQLQECMNIFKLRKIKISSIGRSVLGKELYLLRIGTGPFKIHINASIHGNEWITTPIILNFLSDLMKESFYDNLASNITLDIVPMVNPDGVDLVCGKTVGNINSYPFQSLLFLNNFRNNFSNWKSNINGVDLNRNFPANYNRYKYIISKQNNTDYPSPKFYAGEFALSEPESMCLAKLCQYQNYDLAVALHTQGRVIYYTYNELEPVNSLIIAQKLSIISNYGLEEPEPDSSFAGFKDWFILDFNKPGFTFELGLGENPLNYEKFQSLYEEVYFLLLNTMFTYKMIENT